MGDSSFRYCFCGRQSIISSLLGVGNCSSDWVQIHPKVPSFSGMCSKISMVKDHPISLQPTRSVFNCPPPPVCFQVTFLWACWVGDVPLVWSGMSGRPTILLFKTRFSFWDRLCEWVRAPFIVRIGYPFQMCVYENRGMIGSQWASGLAPSVCSIIFSGFSLIISMSPIFVASQVGKMATSLSTPLVWHLHLGENDVCSCWFGRNVRGQPWLIDLTWIAGLHLQGELGTQE